MKPLSWLAAPLIAVLTVGPLAACPRRACAVQRPVLVTKKAVVEVVAVQTAVLVVPQAIRTVIVEDRVVVPAYGSQSSYGSTPAGAPPAPARATVPAPRPEGGEIRALAEQMAAMATAMQDLAAGMKTLNDNQTALDKRLRAIEEEDTPPPPPAKEPPPKMPRAETGALRRPADGVSLAPTANARCAACHTSGRLKSDKHIVLLTAGKPTVAAGDVDKLIGVLADGHPVLRSGEVAISAAEEQALRKEFGL
jgi:hypothetical protein